MKESDKRYPLQWPPGWKRTKYPKPGTCFGKNHTIFSTSKRVNHELELLGATNIILSTNLRLNRDGTTPASNQRQPEDQAVVVYFKFEGADQCIPCDRWENVEHNIHAVGLCISAIRGLARWGAGEFVRAAFTGFKAIPEKTGMDFRYILGLDGRDGLNMAESKYKGLAMRYHPDKPEGSNDKMAELNSAMEQARKHFS